MYSFDSLLFIIKSDNYPLGFYANDSSNHYKTAHKNFLPRYLTNLPLFGEGQPLLLLSPSDFKIDKLNGLFPSTII